MQKVVTVLVSSSKLNEMGASIHEHQYPELNSLLGEGFQVINVIPQVTSAGTTTVFLTFVLDDMVASGTNVKVI